MHGIFQRHPLLEGQNLPHPFSSGAYGDFPLAHKAIPSAQACTKPMIKNVIMPHQPHYQPSDGRRGQEAQSVLYIDWIDLAAAEDRSQPIHRMG
ncbi:hypothetical protein [Azotobacter salinestris]|uniref:hypothetical protein n=1 Tax=Azotobacter salinestris TaxID=69964 RepID=UPI0032DEF5B7